LTQDILSPIAKQLNLGELTPKMDEWNELVLKILKPYFLCIANSQIIICTGRAEQKAGQNQQKRYSPTHL
jgi:hypothetical protein